MTRFTVPDIKRGLWRKYLPWLSSHGAVKDTPHDYFGVFFKDADNTRYMLHSIEKHKDQNQDAIFLTPLLQDITVRKNIS